MGGRQVKRSRRVALVCVAVLCGVLTLPVTGASANDASIKTVLRTYLPKILESEGKVVTTLGEYKQSGNPSGFQAAMTNAISVLQALKSKIAAQSATSRRVQRAKSKLEKGLQAVITAYGALKTAVGEKKASPEAAKAEAKKALISVKKGQKQLRQGVSLLH